MVGAGVVPVALRSLRRRSSRVADANFALSPFVRSGALGRLAGLAWWGQGRIRPGEGPRLRAHAPVPPPHASDAAATSLNRDELGFVRVGVRGVVLPPLAHGGKAVEQVDRAQTREG